MTRAFDRNVMHRMKLLHGVIRRHQAAQPLLGWKVLFIQHQLENHLAQAQAILSLGVDPSDLHWLDIPYTSSPEIREVLQEAGIPEPNFTVHNHNLMQHYATYQRTRTGEWIKRFIKEHGSRVSLLVLDDGGYFLEALIPFREKFDRLAVVEQTMRGIEKLRENIAIRYHYRDVPLVDVATSDPKKSIEPAFIAAAVVEAIRERLAALKDRAATPRKILALGYGAIGSAVASKLPEEFGLDRKQIFVFDNDRRKRAQSLEDGFAPWERSNFDHEFEMVIGCTGTLSFDAWNFVHLTNNALLVNASSGTAEFSREAYIALAETSPSDAIRVIDKETLHERDIHSDIAFHMMGREVIMANGGFPINFDGRLDRIPAEDIQLTVALMVEAAVQAVTSERKGLMPLDVFTCARLMAEFGETRSDKGKASKPATQTQAALAES